MAAKKKKKALPKKKKAAAPKKKAVKKKKKAPKKRPAGPSPKNAKAWAPGKLVTHENNFSLIYVDFAHGDLMEEKGIEGGGYTWHGLVDHVLKTDAPSALKYLDFDPEGSMFAVVSTDLAALHEVAK